MGRSKQAARRLGAAAQAAFSSPKAIMEVAAGLGLGGEARPDDDVAKALAPFLHCDVLLRSNCHHSGPRDRIAFGGDRTGVPAEQARPPAALVCRLQNGGVLCRRERMPEPDLTVAVVDPNPARAAILEEGLRGAGVRNVVVIPDTAGLLYRLSEVDADVVVIDLESPSRDLLEQLFHVSRLVERPVAMFVDQSDASMMQAAVDAGISAYVVDGLQSDRVKSIVDVAILRFNAFARLQRELEDTKSELAARKTIERAKGLLMKAKNLTEEEAYALLRRKAMNEKRKIADIAQALVTSAELLQ
jgi:response regulator NasT